MKIRHANNSDLDKVCDILATEFFNDPVLKFAFTNADKVLRMEIMKRFFSVYVKLAMDYGGTLIDESDSGVLVYFKPEFMNLNNREKNMINELLFQECGTDYANVFAFMNGLDYYHPVVSAHYYIFLIAVQRLRRGTGLVNSLFSKMNSILDKEKCPCYAECTRFSTRTLVRRFGYHDIANPLDIDGFPALYPVWREPK